MDGEARASWRAAQLDRRRVQLGRRFARWAVVRWLRSGSVKPQRTPSPFNQGLADGREEGYSAGYADGFQAGRNGSS